MSGRNGSVILVGGVALVLLVVGGLFLSGAFDDAADNGGSLGIEGVEVSDSGDRRKVDRSGPRAPLRTADYEKDDPRNANSAGRVANSSTGQRVAGLVRDSSGRVIPGARVILSRDIGTIKDRFIEGEVLSVASSSSNGRFSFDDVPLQSEMVLRVEHDDYIVERVFPINSSKPKTMEQVVTLREGLFFEGTVVDEARRPILGARVEVFDATLQSRDPRGVIERFAETDDTGKFSVGPLAGGNKRVVVSKEGFTSDGRSSLQITEMALPKIEFVLGQGRTIVGIVRDSSSGLPIEGARIMGRPMSFLVGQIEEPGEERRFDPDGEGPYNRPNSAGKPDFSGSTENPQGARRARGAALRGVRSRARGSVGDKQFLIAVAESDAEGRFILGGLMNARYTLSVSRPGFLALTGRPANAGDSEVELQVTPSARIAGIVVDAETDEPIKHFNISVHPTMEPLFFNPAQKQSFSSEDGSFEFLDVQPGRQFVFAEAPGYAVARSDPYEIGRQQIVTGVVVRLERGATLIGQVMGPGGQPLKGAVATLVKETPGQAANPLLAVFQSQMRGNSSKKSTTDDTGKWVIENVGAGSYRVDVTHPSFVDGGTDPFDCTSRGEYDVQPVQLGLGGGIRGIVKTKDGQPDSKATVMIRPSTGGPMPNTSLQTDSGGVFERKGLPPGLYTVMVIQREGAMDLASVLNQSGKQVNVVEGETIDLEL